MKGRYPKAFVGEPPYDRMGVKTGDEEIMHAPLDWVDFLYTRRVVSDASHVQAFGGGGFSGTRNRS